MLTTSRAPRRALLLLAPLLLLGSALAAQTVDSVAPGSVVRGRATEVIVRGTDLDAVTAARLAGDGAIIAGVEALPSVLTLAVQVGDRALLGPRALTLEGSGGDVDAGALEVVAGPAEVFSSTPSTTGRATTFTLSVTGRNLDTVTAASFGDGVSATAWAAESPVRASAQVTVSAAAFSGARALTLATPGGVVSFEAALTIEGGEPTVANLVPAALARGASATIRVEGQNLDRVTDLRFGSRIFASGFTVESPTRATIDVSVGEDATAGARAVTAIVDEVPRTLAASLTVEPGDLDVATFRPDRIQRGRTTRITIEGVNLDGVDTVDLGAGVSAAGFLSAFPTSIEVELTVAADAVLGLRDVEVTGPNGTAVVLDGIGIIERITPPPSLVFPDRVELPRAQAGARSRGGFQIENTGAEDEVLVIGPLTGDTANFALLGEDGLPVDSIEVALASGERGQWELAFSPVERGTFGVIVPLTVRGGEEVGQIVVIGPASSPKALFGAEPPVDYGVFEAGSAQPLPRLDTLVASGVLPRSIVIEAISLAMWRDGVPLDDAALPVSFDIESTVSGDTLYWGTTEIVWSVDGEAGVYLGELVFETDDAEALEMPFAFTLEIRGTAADAGPDAGGDAGPDAGDAGPDAGDDAGPDTGDAGPDTAIDAGPDAGPDAAPDAASDALADAGSDGTPDSSDDAGGSDDGGGGGCSAAGGGAAFPALLPGMIAALRRRRTRSARD